MSDRVVVTGMGAWTPYGQGVEAFWAGLLSGASARSTITRFDVDHPAYRTREAAVISEIGSEALGQAEQGAAEVLDAVLDEALAAARWPARADGDYDTGVFMGASQSMSDTFRSYLLSHRTPGVPYALNLATVPESAAHVLGTVASRAGAFGPAAMVSTACASGTSAIGMAYDMIRQGRIRRAIAGGIGYMSEISLTGFNILRLTGRSGCRPFDKSRDGLMLGDGYAMVVLELESSAAERNAVPVAEVLGYSATNEAHHATSPNPDGVPGSGVMWGALNRSESLLSRLDYINAHGTGTAANDAAELRAIERLVSRCPLDAAVSVSSTKGHHGHSLGATGAVEFVATVLAIQHGILPPNLGLADPEDTSGLIDLVQGEPKARTVRVALSNSFGFGGNVASIAVGAPRTDA